MINFLYSWQTLIGSIIGAAAAFLLWVVAEFFRRVSNRNERLPFLVKIVGMEAMIAADAYKAINDFLNDRFSKLVQQASGQTNSTSYFVGTVFFPILSLQALDRSLLNLHTGSGYVDVKFMQIVKRSRDFADTIDDIKRQFETTLNGNRELALLNKNPAQVQNKQFKDDLDSFLTVIRSEILENNIPIYVKEIAEAQVSLSELQKVPLWWWKFRNGVSFKYFLNRKEMNHYVKTTHQRIDTRLKGKFKSRFDEINTAFSPELKFVPDSTAL